MLIATLLVAAFCQLLGGLAYVRDTLNGRTKPNRVSWALWAAAPIIAVAIALTEGAPSWSLLPVFMAGFVPVLILVSSYFNAQAYWRLDRFDYLCGTFGALALLMWLWASQPIIAVIMLVTTDALAALPTIRKAWSNPDTETSIAYVAALFGGLAALANIHEWVVLHYAFPIYLVGVNLMLLFAIYRKGIFVRANPTGTP